MLDELLKVLLDIDKQAVCLIISSSSKHFCAGADLKERSAMDYNETIDFLNKINKIPWFKKLWYSTLFKNLDLAVI